jgi:hypothetical protein
MGTNEEERGEAAPTKFSRREAAQTLMERRPPKAVECEGCCRESINRIVVDERSVAREVQSRFYCWSNNISTFEPYGL